MSHLDELLQLKQGEGIFDSEGRMSLDLQSQLAALSSSMLGTDTQALLKIVQGLMGYRCRSVQILQCPSEMSIYAENIDQQECLAGLQDGFSRCLELKDVPSTDLLVGLSRFLLSNPLRIFISQWHEGNIGALKGWSGDGSATQIGKPPSEWRAGLGLHIQWDGQNQNPITIDRLEFSRRLFYARCFVYLQGEVLGLKAFRALNFLDSQTESFMVEESKTDFWFLEYYRLCDPGPNSCWPRPIDRTCKNLSPDVPWPQRTIENNNKESGKSQLRKFGRRTDRQPAFLEHLKSLTWASAVFEKPFSFPLVWCDGACVIRDFRTSLPTQIYVIKRGILIDSFASVALTAEHGNASVVVCWDECPTDLSQFKIRGGETVLEVERRARETLLEALQLSREQVDYVEEYSAGHSLDTGERIAWGTSTIGGAGALCLASLNPASLLLLPVLAFGSYLVIKEVHSYRHGHEDLADNLALIDRWISAISSAQ